MVKKNNVEITAVIPVYKNAVFIQELTQRLSVVLEKLVSSHEIIYVNDGSPDNAWEIITEKADKKDSVKGIYLSRNFGQHAAITAGLSHCCGEWVVVMDGDLQDVPEEIEKLYEKAKGGYEVVFARRVERQDSFFQKISSRLFYKVLDLFTDGKTDPAVANFGIYSRKVIDNYNRMKEQHRIFPLFVKWMGFNTAYVNVQHRERLQGKSSYTFSRKINLAIDTIVSMSNKPLKLAIRMGFYLSGLAFLYGFFLIYRYFFSGISVEGWTTLAVSLYFLTGLVISMLGLLGLYIGKVFDEVKGRPIFIVEKVCGKLDID